MNRILSLLTRPQDFFEGLETPWPLRGPALVVLATGLLAGATAIPVTRLTFEMLPAEAAAYAGIGLVAAVVGAVIVTLVLWVVTAAIAHGLSALFGGDGAFRRTLAAIGYGYVPMAIGTAISGILMWQLVATARVEPVADPLQIQDAITGLMSDPLGQAATVVGILFLLWAANIWVFGLREARTLSTRHALICVAVPVAIQVIMSASQYLG
ncbi:MAG: YIP1 family protein [Methanomicrobiales archaeon]